MKKIKLYLTLLLGVCFLSCTKDNDLGVIPPLGPDYTLPQGSSPADGRIVDFYNAYGTYVLYEFTDADFRWSQMEGSTADYSFTKADPQYADEMLDLLEQAWVSLYPAEFHKKYMPYRIFLTDGLFYGSTQTPVKVWVDKGKVAVAGCSAALKDMTAAEKSAFKAELQQNLWKHWAKSMEFPNSFFTVSNYTVNCQASPDSPNYPRTRGFVANNGEEWAIYSGFEWWQKGKLDSEMDLLTYLGSMVSRTSEEWASDMEYSLVKQKYDILRSYIQESLGIDLKAVGDAVCE